MERLMMITRVGPLGDTMIKDIGRKLCNLLKCIQLF